ncbi:MAG: AAA family ATPase, partial [Candidatus Sulfotelmatobacter sp.]
EKNTVKFLDKMTKRGVIDGPVFCEPKFFWFSDYEAEDYDPEDEDCTLDHRNLNNELDAEKFRNFIATSVDKRYRPIKSVLVLTENWEYDGKLKYLDRILEVPVWKEKHKDKTIRPEVYQLFVDEQDESSFTKVSNDSRNGVVKRSIELVRGDQVKPEEIRFLVPNFVPLHQPVVFSGEMDTRKSTLALDIAAAGSCWRPWFMGEENECTPFLTLVAAAEDNFATTTLPRFMAAGGVRDCLYGVKLDVQTEQQTNDGLKVYSTPLSFDEHLNLLGEKIVELNSTREWRVGMLINDPIIALFGNKNYNNPQDSRDIMRGLTKLCEELHITIANIAHFNKTLGLTAKQKTAGSKALVEAHRQAWAFDLMEDDKKITLIAPIKHNLLKDARSYKITTVGKDIEWEIGEGYYQKANVGVIKFVGYSNMTADERIEEREDKGRGSRKEIKKAILDLLKNGPLPAGQVCNALQDLGSMRTIQRAAGMLEEEGKLSRVGNNNKNLVWQLATEPRQASFDDAEAVRNE